MRNSRDTSLQTVHDCVSSRVYDIEKYFYRFPSFFMFCFYGSKRKLDRRRGRVLKCAAPARKSSRVLGTRDTETDRTVRSVIGVQVQPGARYAFGQWRRRCLIVHFICSLEFLLRFLFSILFNLGSSSFFIYYYNYYTCA